MGVRTAAARAAGLACSWGMRTLLHRSATTLPGRVALVDRPPCDCKPVGEAAPGEHRGVRHERQDHDEQRPRAGALRRPAWTCCATAQGRTWSPGSPPRCSRAAGRTGGSSRMTSFRRSASCPRLKPRYPGPAQPVPRPARPLRRDRPRAADVIAAALEGSPGTVLLYNADDPLCEGVAREGARRRGGSTLAFGIDERPPPARETAWSACGFCQCCGAPLSLPRGASTASSASYACTDVRLRAAAPRLLRRPTSPVGEDGVAFTVHGGVDRRARAPRGPLGRRLHGLQPSGGLRGRRRRSPGRRRRLVPARPRFLPPGERTPAALRRAGPPGDAQPRQEPHGLQPEHVAAACRTASPKVVYVVINDDYNDGKDVSWLWDVDFERLRAGGPEVRVFAGGHRANDMQVRLKYAGVEASDHLGMRRRRPRGDSTTSPRTCGRLGAHELFGAVDGEGRARTHGGGSMSSPLKIAHLFPELLNLYGDGGNIIVLERRCAWRGIEVEVMPVRFGERPSFSDVDIAFIGGGSDREQKHRVRPAARRRRRASVLRRRRRGPACRVRGATSFSGHSYLMGDDEVAGLSLVDLYTDRGDPRLIGNVMVATDLTDEPVVGYENHGGRTHLGSGVRPFGRVLHGHGNDGTSGEEGCLYRNVVGTYIHGPLLPKNPDVADWLHRPRARTQARQVSRRARTASTTASSLRRTALWRSACGAGRHKAWRTRAMAAPPGAPGRRTARSGCRRRCGSAACARGAAARGAPPARGARAAPTAACWSHAPRCTFGRSRRCRASGGAGRCSSRTARSNARSARTGAYLPADGGSRPTRRAWSARLLDLQRQGAHNINLVTATHYAPHVRSAVAAARARGLAVPVVYNTSGYELPEVVDALSETVQVWLPDFKYADAGLAASLSAGARLPGVRARRARAHGRAGRAWRREAVRRGRHHAQGRHRPPPRPSRAY